MALGLMKDEWRSELTMATNGEQSVMTTLALFKLMQSAAILDTRMQKHTRQVRGVTKKIWNLKA